MDKNAVALFGLFPMPVCGSREGDNPVQALNLEVGLYGYTLSEELAGALRSLNEMDFRNARTRMHAVLREVSGEGSNHNVLFAKFPYSTPDQWDYLARRLIACAMNALSMPPVKPVVLESGLLVDTALFDPAEFGVDPVTQFAVPEMKASENVKAEFRRITPLKILEAGFPHVLVGRVSALLARGSSLSAAERAFIEEVRSLGNPERPARVFRETLPIVHSFFGNDREYIAGLLKGATDLLRIAVYMSNPAADLSLAEPSRFSLRTSQRKTLLGLLDGIGNAAEDMLRHREMWLRLGERLNPGTAANTARYPNAERAFHLLRNTPERIPSFNRTIERGFGYDPLDTDVEAAFRALASRPGEALRRMDRMLRECGEPALSVIAGAAERAGLRSVFSARAYLRSRLMDGDRRGLRSFSIKGKTNRFKTVEDKRTLIEPELLRAAENSLNESLNSRLRELPSMGRVYVDPELRHRIMPVNRRGDSASASPVTKGSAYPMDLENLPVLRLFVHWTGNVDVDLSLNVYDENWTMLQSMGFYNTSGTGIVHSGDVQDAPEGASEFIDVELRKLPARARYLVPSVISYRGDGFNTFPCYTGYMGRDALRSGKRYEPESVLLKFDVTSATRSVQPAAFDVRDRRVIHMDLTTGGGRYMTAHSRDDKMAEAAQAVIEMRERRVTLYDVAYAHAAARGELMDNPQDADIAFTPATDIEVFEALANSDAPAPEHNAEKTFTV